MQRWTRFAFDKAACTSKTGVDGGALLPTQDVSSASAPFPACSSKSISRSLIGFSARIVGQLSRSYACRIHVLLYVLEQRRHRHRSLQRSKALSVYAVSSTNPEHLRPTVSFFEERIGWCRDQFHPCMCMFLSEPKGQSPEFRHTVETVAEQPRPASSKGSDSCLVQITSLNDRLNLQLEKAARRGVIPYLVLDDRPSDLGCWVE